ncbi:Signal recognition particle receptor FtsY [Saliniradius amylolyticus]|uniref:Signal recognition particle receptor FtsY n=1 Tax=Saliniradius amylolyticus TaxID=2183582 RepID=A0A2S2E1E6_9ALTE|nr:signal recognition particle-docking protein FtsY [Saliniradius amylolyticus]AWL10857.1 Signal recognition particle receptor FtsY [Saliniradius amylolyticus]
MSKLFGWFGKKKNDKKDNTTPVEPESPSKDEPQSDASQSDASWSPETLGEPSPMPSESEADSVSHHLDTPPKSEPSDNDDPVNPHTIAEPSPMPSEAEAHSVDHQVSGDEEQTQADDEPAAKEQQPEHHKAFNPHTLGEPSPMPSESEAEEAEHLQPEPEEGNKLGFFSRLKQRLSKTSANLGGGLVSLFKGKKIDDELFEELETQLLVADVGINTTTKIIDELTDKADRAQLKDGEALYQQLKQQLTEMLTDVSQPLNTDTQEGPFVILMVGVNGVGKTTTIGKLAKQFRQQGKSVMLAAGDTFRAAAVEQLQTWGERNEIPVIAQHTGADSASVIYDALEAAKARGTDIVIADTAGRLQNKANLMAELEKIVRVMRKLDANAPHEIMLALDATTGQNALSQTKLFNEAVGLTGLCVTKLDGTAKGGVLFALADQFGIPIRYIGIGESIDDLRPFDGEQFVEALFSESSES